MSILAFLHDRPIGRPIIGTRLKKLGLSRFQLDMNLMSVTSSARVWTTEQSRDRFTQNLRLLLVPVVVMLRVVCEGPVNFTLAARG